MYSSRTVFRNKVLNARLTYELTDIVYDNFVQIINTD
jgi:hypothetical protein